MTLALNNSQFREMMSTRANMRSLAEYALASFKLQGKQVRTCRPAFAMGCEMRPVVMQAIRREQRGK